MTAVVDDQTVSVRGLTGQVAVAAAAAAAAVVVVVLCWLVPWRSGRTLVFHRRAFAVLRSTYS